MRAEDRANLRFLRAFALVFAGLMLLVVFSAFGWKGVAITVFVAGLAAISMLAHALLDSADQPSPASQDQEASR